MPSKIQLDENLWFLFVCLQNSDYKAIDFNAVGDATNLKPPAARMRYTRLKRQIETGTLIGTHGTPFAGGKEKIAAAMRKRKRNGPVVSSKSEEDAGDRGGKSESTEGDTEHGRSVGDGRVNGRDALSVPHSELGVATVIEGVPNDGRGHPFEAQLPCASPSLANAHATAPRYRAQAPRLETSPLPSAPVTRAAPRSNGKPRRSKAMIKLEPADESLGNALHSSDSASEVSGFSSVYSAASTDDDDEDVEDEDSDDEKPIAKRQRRSGGGRAGAGVSKASVEGQPGVWGGVLGRDGGVWEGYGSRIGMQMGIGMGGGNAAGNFRMMRGRERDLPVFERFVSSEF